MIGEKNVDVLPKSFLNDIHQKSNTDHKWKHFSLPSDVMTAIHCHKTLKGYPNISMVIESLIRKHLMGDLNVSENVMSNRDIVIRKYNPEPYTQ